MHLAGGDLRALEVADVVHLAGVFQDSGNIGSYISLAVRDADYHGAFLACYPDLSGVVCEHQFERIRAAHAHHGLHYRVNGGVQVLLVVVVNELDCNFCIGVAVERVIVALELFFKLLVVLDYAVMNTYDLGLDLAGAAAGAVARNVGVSVGLRGLAVGRPAGMAYSAGAG